MPSAWAALPRAQRWMIGALAALLLLVQIRQPFPDVAPLHHIPTLVLLLAVPFLLRLRPMSNAAVGCVVLFFVLHTIGGRYTYSSVPYDRWSEALFGISISEIFGFDRNHYDRLVHLSYGLLAVPPTLEFLQRHVGVARRVALYIAIESVIAVSAVYELFEWFLSIVLAGPMAADYNGQQGDMWDAQKDMALAAIGAIVSAAILSVRRWRRNPL
ncbi:MAG: DUF2238 domain-containing protein [Sphingomicrobium sp.]